MTIQTPPQTGTPIDSVAPEAAGLRHDQLPTSDIKTARRLPTA